MCAGINGDLPVLIRSPKLILKNTGSSFANVWIEYNRIKEMNLSEDGVLVMQLEQRRLLIRVKNR